MAKYRKNYPEFLRLLLLVVLFVVSLAAVPCYAVTEVGLLTWKSSELYEKAIEALQKHIRDESPHVVLVRRDACCSMALFEEFLADFAARDVKALVVLGSEAAQMVSREREGVQPIPTVALCVSDPFCLDLEGPGVDSAYPLTGVSYFIPIKKHLSLFSYLYPEAKKLAFLYDPANPAGALVELPEMLRAGRALGFEVLPVAVETREQLEGCVQTAVAGADMIILATNKLIFGNTGQIIQSAGDVPVFSLSEEGVPAGAVAALYADRYELGRVAAGQVQQILRGIPARDIPFHYPTFERLSVNLSSARRWGVVVPRRVMEGPSMIWRSSSLPEWYGENGRLKEGFRLQNDPDGRSYLRVGLICQNAAESHPFLAGAFKGLQLGRSNYEVEMLDVHNRIDLAATTLNAYKQDMDLILTVGGGLLDRVKYHDLPVPVVFTGAFVSDVMTLAWQNSNMTGSTYFLDPVRQVTIMMRLFGGDRTYLLAEPLSSSLAGGGESDSLYLEMLTSGLDVERVRVSSDLPMRRQAEHLFLALYEQALLSGKEGLPPVLVIPNDGEVYRCLPELGEILSETDLSIPIYVTSAWGLRWGGTVAPDVDPEEVGLVAGRYVVQILEQGISPRDLPVWGGRGMNSLCINRRWKEISNWSVPESWTGPVREIVTEAMP